MPLTGLSFAPLKTDQANGNGQPTGPAPIQEAIRVLNLQIPKVVGARALAPGPLLTAPGAAGVPGAGGLDALLRRLLAQLVPGPAQNAGPAMGGPQGGLPAMGPAMASAPPPRITPGIQPGDTPPRSPFPRGRGMGR